MRHPDLVALMVAVGNDPVAGQALREEVLALLPPWTLASRSGFRHDERLSEADLAGLALPTLIIWGDRDPVGSVATARRVAAHIPGGALAEVNGGHAPWLGAPEAVARVLTSWLDRLPIG